MGEWHYALQTARLAKILFVPVLSLEYSGQIQSIGLSQLPSLVASEGYEPT